MEDFNDLLSMEENEGNVDHLNWLLIMGSKVLLRILGWLIFLSKVILSLDPMEEGPIKLLKSSLTRRWGPLLGSNIPSCVLD